jgi:hypothetical protein
MKQAIHIFLKDVRGLWRQVASLMLIIGLFAAEDVANGVYNSGFSFVPLIVGAAVWFLIARAVHQESLPGENQFWLTRPYERNSLLISKILMVACIVIVPFFVADCIILLAQSLPFAANFGGLVLRQFIVAAWLVLPPFAIATVTRSITEDIMVWIAGLAIAGLTYFPGNNIPDFHSSNEKYLILVALVLMLIVIWRQYSTRDTKIGRAIIAAAVLLPALSFPEPAALAIEGLRNDPATSTLALVPQANKIAELPRAGMYDVHCAPVDVRIESANPKWKFRVLSQEDTFSVRGKTWSMGWRRTGGDFAGVFGTVDACLDTAGLNALGTTGPLSVRTSIALGVVTDNSLIVIPATLKPFDAPGIGQCQFQHIFRSLNYQLACKAPVSFPAQGRVRLITSSGSSGSGIAAAVYPWLPLNLLPGISPVYKWVTLPMDTQIRDAIAQGGNIEFQTETRIAVLRREFTVAEARFQPPQ